MPAPVSLRPLGEGDIAHIIAWGDDPLVELHFGKPFGSPAEIARFRHQTRHGQRLSMAIILPPATTIGLIEAANICWPTRTGELSVFIGEETYRGHGYGTAAVELFLTDLFERAGLERVYLRVARHNARARRCYEKCGFRARGLLPRSARQPGRDDELVLMELARGTWERGRRQGSGVTGAATSAATGAPATLTPDRGPASIGLTKNLGTGNDGEE